jgi:hypothetical protein
VRAGDLVTFLGLSEKGWARGVDSRGKVGFFPSGFCVAVGSEEDKELLKLMDEIAQEEQQLVKAMNNREEPTLEDVVMLAERLDMEEKIANATKQLREASPPPSAPPSPPPSLLMNRESENVVYSTPMLPAADVIMSRVFFFFLLLFAVQQENSRLLE